jgi:hypothetical protein
MSRKELVVEVEPECICLWKKPWAKRTARVTLLVDFRKQFVTVVDASCGLWFLPGGGLEQNESVEGAAKREAMEELGLNVKVNSIIKMYHVTLNSVRTEEQLKIPPFIAVHATCIGGRLKKGYASNRRLLLVGKDKCHNLLMDSEVPKECEWMKPYLYVSKETLREFSSINPRARAPEV